MGYGQTYNYGSQLYKGMALPTIATGFFRIATNDLSAYVDIPLPNYPYKSTIKLAFDIQELDNGDLYIRDEGNTYDKRYCDIDLILTPTQQYNLNQQINYTNRAQTFVLILPSTQCGFFPFGPDLGNVGPFQIICTYPETPKINYAPFKYFTCKLQFALVGAPPPFTLPTQIDDGPLSVAGIGTVNLPPDLFEPDQEYAYDVQLTENSTPQFINRGTLGDCVKSEFTLLCNYSKSAAIVNALAVTYRATGLPLIAPSPTYALGVDQGASGTYTLNNISDTLEITNEDYNRFSMKVSLHQV